MFFISSSRFLLDHMTSQYACVFVFFIKISVIFFLVLLVFVVLFAVLSLNLIDDMSQRWSLKTLIIDVIVMTDC